LPRPSAKASAKFANQTVNAKTNVTTPLYVRDAFVGPKSSGSIVKASVTSVPTHTTNITGLRICTRGSNFASDPISACRKSSGV
jgi:hypothetical protein